ncbi:hypothetical protein EQW76_11225, partial [Rhizobium sp. rho-13.1]
MDDTSNSGDGIGLSRDDAASRIMGILDTSDGATETDTSNAENGADEALLPSDDENESTEEQAVEASDEPVEHAEDAAEDAEEDTSPTLSEYPSEVNRRIFAFARGKLA